ncbi:MAG: glycosyltransferase family 4 protein [Anaerolineae bacterium]|jgi:glycosyltransferase involved in cell wall biosynthesis
MNILFLSTWFPHPPDNGSKLRVYHLLRGLAERHEVTLLSFAFATARPDAPGELDAWCRAVRTVPIDPYEANRAGTLHTFLSPRPVASRPIAAMSRLAAETLAARPFDAVIASTGMTIDYALAAPPGVVRVLEEHNAMTRWAWEDYRQATGALSRARRWLSWRKNRWYETRTFSRFDLLTMVSEADRQATADALGRRGPRVEVVPNGVDCAHNRPGLARPRPAALVFNGSLTYSANYDAMRWFLAEVWPRIRAQIPEATLAITGSTAGVDLAGLALDDRVTLLGFVEDVRIPVAEAAVAVAPIRQGGGTRLKILEAMALGTPVVATSKGAEGHDVIDGQHLLLADDPQPFAAAVLRLLADDALAARLRRNARQLVEQRYDWHTIGRRFLALVEETVQAQRPLSSDGS